MIAPELIGLLRCPISGSQLELADNQLVASVNQAIENRSLQNRKGVSIVDRIDGGLVNADRSWLCPIRHGIVSMVSDEMIEINPTCLKKGRA